MDEVFDTLRSEFSDISSVGELTRVIVRLGVAVVLGGLIGWNRERRGTAAGLRTHMMVALGSALFALVPVQAGMSENEASRVLQGIIAGIGFLGAGAIIKVDDKEQIKGLTTAAGIWATAAIGIAAGLGREVLATVSTLLALVILGVLPRLERAIQRRAPSDPSANTRAATPSPPGERDAGDGRG